ncbi:hypothetical protein [Nonomuraea basaltis]|uniref:hypothetical protein n=1 Tax=Nonomuraea basaltis TaxID=2495887 RepID=UPI00110C57A3|nr:hypothetical protein [Nonomuraea basaltis]
MLRGRTLHPTADQARLSRFSDDVWDTSPAAIHNEQVASGAHFAPIPDRFRIPVKTFALAVLDYNMPPPLIIGSAGGDKASLVSFHQWVRTIRVLATWLETQQIQAISNVTHHDLDRYRAHVLGLSVSCSRKADYLQIVRALWAYRDHLPHECRLPPERPWGSASARQLAGDIQLGRQISLGSKQVQNSVLRAGEGDIPSWEQVNRIPRSLTHTYASEPALAATPPPIRPGSWRSTTGWTRPARAR